MLISKAYAAAESTAAAVTAEAPNAMEAFGLNMLLIFVLVGMFYVLLIMPQQKRFAQHREMLNALKKGDRIVTVGGLIGTIDTIKEGEQEVILDLGNGLKVTALRHSIQGRPDAHKAAPMKDAKKDEKKDEKKSA
jgi:preprotein translocase subunit YajC